MNRHVFLKVTFSCLFAASTAMVAFPSAAAGGHATPEEAVAMMQKATSHVKKVGPEKAYQDFSTGTEFKDRELYVIAFTMGGKALAHGGNPKLVGKELIGMQDPDGKLVVKNASDVALEKGKGWTPDYKFRNPVTDKIEKRKMYVEKVGDSWLGVGIFLD